MSEASAGLELPEKASVVVVGAGLSGLVATYDLVKAGIDVVLVEAQDAVGGVTQVFERENGRILQMGGELTGALQPTMLAVAAELGVEVEPMPVMADPENMGAFVRITAGERHVEPYPLADDPEALEAYTAAAAKFDELMKGMPAEEPWTDPRAAELDRQTVGGWLDENIDNAVARETFEFEFFAAGPPYETSLLHLLSFLARHGGMEGFAGALPDRFVGGTSSIVDGLSSTVGKDRIVLSAPVRKVKHYADGAVVETDRGSIGADAVIFAMAPGLLNAIEFVPALPADRAKLQSRWIKPSGAKIIAIYETPFWREDGLAGFASGLEFLALSADFSPTDGSEGIMVSMVFDEVSATSSDRVARILEDPDRTREATLAELETYYGPKAREVKELHVFDYNGARWSSGSGGAFLSPGVLTRYGPALRRPVGRLLWAGADNGTGDYMEGAASGGRAAAAAAAEMVGALEREIS